VAATGTNADMIGFLLGLIVVGLIAGFLARLLVPGRDPMGVFGTMVLGIVGSFVAGFLAKLLFNDTSVGLIGSVIGAIICLLVWRAVGGRRRSVF
jgi:uncharacterized membrane protein YeaQ/YmgE (transglycosylase-associated protein family)